MQNLKNYQKDAIIKYESNIQNGIKGIYVFHDVGTGKTLTSIGIINHAAMKKIYTTCNCSYSVVSCVTV
jgi:type I site-specific restriction endonuclease